MPFLPDIPNFVVDKLPQFNTPKKGEWPSLPLQRGKPPECDEEDRVYPDDCECKFMCENFFMQTTSVIGKISGVINTVQGVAGRIDSLIGTAGRGLRDLLLRNPIVLPIISFVEEAIDAAKDGVNPRSRILEILNGQGISSSCGWMSCAFASLRSAIDSLDDLPSIDDGEGPLREALGTKEGAINQAIDLVNDEILGGQKTIASGFLDKLDDLGLSHAGTLADQADGMLDSFGLGAQVRDGIDGFVNCITQSCNRTSCRYRKTFKEYISGPREDMEELVEDPLVGLETGVKDKVKEIRDKKRAANDMIHHGVSDAFTLPKPDPVVCDEDLPTETPEERKVFDPQPGPLEGESPSISEGKPENYPQNPESTITPSTNSDVTAHLVGTGWSVNIVIVKQTVSNFVFNVDPGSPEVTSSEVSGNSATVNINANTAQEVVNLLNGLTLSNGQVFAATVAKAGSTSTGGQLKFSKEVTPVSSPTTNEEEVYRTTILTLSGVDVAFTSVEPKDNTRVYPTEVLRIEYTASENSFSRQVSENPDGEVIFRYVIEPKVKISSLIRQVNSDGLLYAEALEPYDLETLSGTSIVEAEFSEVASEDRQSYQINSGGSQETEEPTNDPSPEEGCLPGEAYGADGSQVKSATEEFPVYYTSSFDVNTVNSFGVSTSQRAFYLIATRLDPINTTSISSALKSRIEFMSGDVAIARGVATYSLEENSYEGGAVVNIILKVNTDSFPTISSLVAALNSVERYHFSTTTKQGDSVKEPNLEEVDSFEASSISQKHVNRQALLEGVHYIGTNPPTGGCPS